MATTTLPAAEAAAASRASPRLWEVDAARGVAVAAMIFFHFMWDLQFFGLTTQDVNGGFGWQTFARAIGTTFIFILGLSTTLDVTRTRAKGKSVPRRVLWRFLQLGAAALAVTVATYLFVGNAFVRFGILHLAAVSVVLASLAGRLPPWANVALGAAVIAAGAFTANAEGGSPWLLPLGVVPPGMDMVDYYPVLPWFGPALFGVAAGQVLYRGGARQFALPDLSASAPVRALCWMGRHSLAIYLIHQLVLIGLIYAAVTVFGLR